MASSPALQGDEDHTRVRVDRVNTANSWIRGAVKAAGILSEAGYPADELDYRALSSAGNDMFKPRGKFVGIDSSDSEEEGRAIGSGGGGGGGLGTDAGWCCCSRCWR